MAQFPAFPSCVCSPCFDVKGQTAFLGTHGRVCALSTKLVVEKTCSSMLLRSARANIQLAAMF